MSASEHERDIHPDKIVGGWIDEVDQRECTVDGLSDIYRYLLDRGPIP